MRGLCALFSLMVSLGGAQAEPLLRVGTEAGFAPYISRNAANEFVGFDRDLMDALCAEISTPCTWSDVAFTALIPGLLDHRFDVIIGGLSATSQRRRLIAFSVPYLITDGALVFVGPQLGTDPQTARIAVQQGTTQETYLRENNYSLVRYATGAEALKAVRTGATDLVFGTEGNLEPIVFSSGNRLKIIQRLTPDSSPAAIGLRPSDEALKLRIDAALTKFHNDGTIERLTKRWFPVGERL